MNELTNPTDTSRKPGEGISRRVPARPCTAMFHFPFSCLIGVALISLCLRSAMAGERYAPLFRAGSTDEIVAHDQRQPGYGEPCWTLSSDRHGGIFVIWNDPRAGLGLISVKAYYRAGAEWVLFHRDVITDTPMISAFLSSRLNKLIILDADDNEVREHPLVLIPWMPPTRDLRLPLAEFAPWLALDVKTRGEFRSIGSPVGAREGIRL